MTKPPVLLLDDNPKWLQIYTSQLLQSKYQLETATKFDDAIAKIESTRYPVVVSDLRLLGRKFGGLDLLIKVKQICENTQVIIITAYGGEAEKISKLAMENGASNLYLKSVVDHIELDAGICHAIYTWQRIVAFILDRGEPINSLDVKYLKLLNPAINDSYIQKQVILNGNYNRRSFVDELDKGFGESEIKEICFYLDVDPENLEGKTKREKIISLITYCERRQRIHLLVTQCVNLRPHLQIKIGLL